MKKSISCILAIVLAVMLITACAQAEQSSSNMAESKPVASSETKGSGAIASSDVLNSRSTGITSASVEEVIASISSEHEGLASIDVVRDDDNYGIIRMYFEPMDWDALDNETRAEMVEKAIRYAYKEAVVYGDAVSADFEGYTSNGKLIFTNLPSGYVVITDTDGSNPHTSDSNIYFEVLVSLPSEHEGLSHVDIIVSDVGYDIQLHFEPVDWDDLDNNTRVAIAQEALSYAFDVAKDYDYSTSGFSGYTSDGDVIIFNDAAGHIVVMNTDGSNIYGTDIWP